jgi:ribosomal protein S18 acetylase RimI-like enzyme
MSYSMRPLSVEDEDFLWLMLFYAAHVDEEKNRSLVDIQQDRVLGSYVRKWGREGDLGFVAVDVATAQPVGATWVRPPDAEGGGYSMVDDKIPELAIAVLPEWMNRGIGTSLLNHLLLAAKGHYPAIVLSVRDTNRARALYERMGFVISREITNRIGSRSYEMIYRLEEEQ